MGDKRTVEISTDILDVIREKLCENNCFCRESKGCGICPAYDLANFEIYIEQKKAGELCQ